MPIPSPHSDKTSDQIDKLLTLPEVRELIGMSSATLYRLIERGHFPPPIKIGRMSRWPVSEISGFVEAFKGQRERDAAYKKKRGL